MSEVVKLWRESTSATNTKLGQSLADPEQYENLFPEFAVRYNLFYVGILYENFYIST